MKFFIKILMIAFLCSITTLSAQNDCPRQDPCCEYEFSVYGQFLYWDIGVNRGSDIATFAASSTDYLTLGSDYQPGYRVGAIAMTSCWALEVRYASLKSNKSLTGFSVDSTGDRAIFKNEIDYSVLDIMLGKPITFKCIRGSILPYVGAKLAWINQETQTETFVVNPVRVDYTNDFSGYGGNVGSKLSLKLWNCCIPTSFIADVSCAFLKGRYKASNQSSDPGNVGEYDDAYALLCVPRFYVGLDCDLFTCNCFNSQLTIGYEAQFWTDYLFTSPFFNFFGRRQSGSLAVDGLVVNLAVGF